MDITGLSNSSISKYLSLGENYSINGFSIRVKSAKPRDDITVNGLDRKTPIRLTHAKSGITEDVDSIRQASKFLRVDRRMVKKHMETGIPYRNYVIEKIN